MMIFVVSINPQLVPKVRAGLVNTTFNKVIAMLTIPSCGDPLTTFVHAEEPGQHVIRVRGPGIIRFESPPVEWDDGTTYNTEIPVMPLDAVLEDFMKSVRKPEVKWGKIVVPNLPSYRTVRLIRV
jgi:hypothetical protein